MFSSTFEKHSEFSYGYLSTASEVYQVGVSISTYPPLGDTMVAGLKVKVTVLLEDWSPTTLEFVSMLYCSMLPGKNMISKVEMSLSSSTLAKSVGVVEEHPW